jgi:hypothetical protein
VKLECAEPASFLTVDNPGKWRQYTSTIRQREKTSRRGSILIMRYLLVQDLFLLTTKGKGRRLDGTSITKDGWSNPEDSQFRSGASYENPFPEPKKDVLIMIC